MPRAWPGRHQNFESEKGRLSTVSAPPPVGPAGPLNTTLRPPPSVRCLPLVPPPRTETWLSITEPARPALSSTAHKTGHPLIRRRRSRGRSVRRDRRRTGRVGCDGCDGCDAPLLRHPDTPRAAASCLPCIAALHRPLAPRARHNHA